MPQNTAPPRFSDPLLLRRGILITAVFGMSKQRSPEMKMMEQDLFKDPVK